MRTIAGFILMLTLVGCHSGPRWCQRDQPNCEKATCTNDSPAESSAKPVNDESAPAPAPAPIEPQAVQPKGTKSSPPKLSMWPSLPPKYSSKPAAAKPAAAQDDAVKQLLADLEKTKREKASLQAKLSEESARQSQHRLEIEARLAVFQDQLRQQSALQPVMYQQQIPAVSRPMPYYPQLNDTAQNFNNPAIVPGAPNPSIPNGWSNSNGSSGSGTYGSNAPDWNAYAPAWNQPAKPPQQVEQWPYSPQR